MSDNNERNPFESGSGDWQSAENPFDSSESPFSESETRATVTEDVGSGDASDRMAQPPREEFIVEEPKKPNGMAIASLVLGIVGVALQLVCCCCAYLSSVPCLIMSAVALGLGIASYKKTKNKMALAGFILGIVGTVLGLIMTIVWIVWIQLQSDPLFWEEFWKEFGDIYGNPDFSGPDSSGRGDMLARILCAVRGFFKR